VVEPTNSELGIAEDRELENWTRCYTRNWQRTNFTRGQNQTPYGMEIGDGGIL